MLYMQFNSEQVLNCFFNCLPLLKHGLYFLEIFFFPRKHQSESYWFCICCGIYLKANHAGFGLYWKVFFQHLGILSVVLEELNSSAQFFVVK